MISLKKKGTWYGFICYSDTILVLLSLTHITEAEQPIVTTLVCIVPASILHSRPQNPITPLFFMGFITV